MDVPAHRAAAVAYVAAAVNLAAAGVMLMVLRQGLPAGERSLADRIAYVGTHPVSWRLGWIVWHAAALTLLGFFVVLARRWRGAAPVLCSLALLCAAAGLAADLGAQAVFMGVLPRLSPDEYRAFETLGVALTGYLGNGLYTVAGILLTVAGRKELPPGLIALGGAAWAAGLWLSAATIAHSSAGEYASAAILLPLFIAWAALVGRWLGSRAS